MGSRLIVGWAYHENTYAKVERVQGAVGTTGTWPTAVGTILQPIVPICPPRAVFAANDSASTLGVGRWGDQRLFFNDRGQRRRTPLSLPDQHATGEPAA